MPHLGLWEITEDSPIPLGKSNVAFEKHLETWIENRPEFVQSGLTIIGRQVRVATGILDLLAVDTGGRCVVIEVKREAIYREAVAQALDYAATVAEMPGDDLKRAVDKYSAERNIDLSERLADGVLEDLYTAEQRDVTIIVVGVGQRPGLERLLRFLNDRSNLEISLVSFESFVLPDGRQILGRELSDSEPAYVTQERPRKSGGNPTLEDLCVQADARGIGRGFRAILKTAQDLDLPTRLYKRSIMYTPPQNRTRMLFTVWLSNADKGVRLISSTDAFAEYFPVSQGQVAAALGPDTTRQLQPDEVDSFIAGLKTLLAPPATGTE